MKLNVARELKEALKAKIEQIAVSAGPSLEAFAAGRSGVLPFGMPRNFQIRSRTSTAAVGVAPSSKKGDYRVALRTAGAVRAADLLAGMGAGDQELDVVEQIRYTPRGEAVEPIPRPPGEVYAGGSCGHYAITAGTLGGFVQDEQRYYILSNNHVLADSDRGFRGDPILEPGPIDVVGGDYRVIGTLEKWVPLRAGTVDAALAIFDPGIEYFHPWTYLGIGHMDPRVITDRYAVRNVTKRGRTTNVTRGAVSAFELDGVTINYGSETRPYIVRFDDQIEMIGTPPEQPFSLPGDSGSLILDAATLRPYALLFAGGLGADGIDRTIASFMPVVLSQLNVQMITS